MTLTDFQRELSTTSRWDFSDLRALFANCTLKPSPERSHTEGLMQISTAIMETNGVDVDFVRAVDHELAPGVWPDMTEHGAARDDWPALYERVQARNATFMTWNLLHLARMLEDAGGVPAHGNQRSLWDAGCRFDFPNPEHR